MFHGIVYDAAHPPADPHYQLSPQALVALQQQLVDVPIRIEHEGAKDVGRVTGARLDNGSLFVDWELHDTAAGWSSERFIEKGIAPELSLQHAVYGDGTVRPIEVSLVRKGARDGCAILVDSYKLDAAGTATSPELVMATAAATPDVVAPPAAEPVAAAPPAETEAPMAVDEAPSSKRKRYETPMDFVNDMQTKVSDPNTLQTILDYFGETMETNVATQQEVTQLRQAKELLEQSQKAHVESSKNVVRDIVDTLSAIFQNYGSVNMEAPHREKLQTLLTENIEAREALRPILVAASAINTLRQGMITASSDAAVTAAAERIAKLSAQLTKVQSTARQLAAPSTAGAAPVAPQWTPAAAPVVEVAASAQRAAPEPPKFVIPKILMEGPSYGEGGVGRITAKDLMRSRNM